MIASAIFLMQAAAGALPEPAPGETQALRLCLTVSKNLLEPSGERADLVAQSVVYACDKEVRAAASAGGIAGNVEGLRERLERRMQFEVIAVRSNGAVRKP